MSAIGHNSGATSPDALNNTAAQQLRSIIDRCERLLLEKDEVLEQVREVLAEAKGNGYDTKIIRRLLRIRRMDRAKRSEEAAILALYASATGDDLDDEECNLV